VDFRLS